MARAYPGILYPIPAFPHVRVDLERMSRDSLRRYLHHRLRMVDAQLRVLMREQDEHSRGQTWQAEAANGAWDAVLEIDYLQSMREAIADTLAAL